MGIRIYVTGGWGNAILTVYRQTYLTIPKRVPRLNLVQRFTYRFRFVGVTSTGLPLELPVSTDVIDHSCLRGRGHDENQTMGPERNIERREYTTSETIWEGAIRVALVNKFDLVRMSLASRVISINGPNLRHR
jgi:hypothetical protein